MALTAGHNNDGSSGVWRGVGCKEIQRLQRKREGWSSSTITVMSHQIQCWVDVLESHGEETKSSCSEGCAPQRSGCFGHVSISLRRQMPPTDQTLQQFCCAGWGHSEISPLNSSCCYCPAQKLCKLRDICSTLCWHFLSVKFSFHAECRNTRTTLLSPLWVRG